MGTTAKKVSVIPAKVQFDTSIKLSDKMLKVAAYCRVSTDEEEQEQVYETTLKYYPMPKIAANNLAILLEKEGKDDVAEEIMNRQKVEETLISQKALAE